MVASARAVRVAIINATVAVGILDAHIETQSKLLGRKREIRTNPRGGTTVMSNQRSVKVFIITKARAPHGAHKSMTSF